MADSTEFIDIFRTVFPVIATVPGNHGELARPDFFGTAFSVGAGVFMTAEHVYRAAAERGDVALGGPSDKPMMGGARVEYAEIWPGRDVALLYCDTGKLTVLDTWLVDRVQVLTDLSSFGFPHAVTRQQESEHFEVVFRAYKGYVITTRGFERLPGRPAIYEVSCPFPEGLSGAPFLWNHDNHIVVTGIVLGCDTVIYGGIEQTVGVALVADEIVELNSVKLGGSLGHRLGLTAAQIRRPGESFEPR